MALELRPAAAFPIAELASVFTAGYEGYPLPIRVDAAAMEFMVDAYDLDLSRSPVALRGGSPVGVTVLGLRGDRGWIGGLGVVAGERRRGVGLALMEAVLEEARGAGVDELTLEVLEQNAPAIALYERLGFARRRLLEVWTLTTDPPISAARRVPVGIAVRRIRALRREPEPWQRADETVASVAGAEALAADEGGAVLFRAAEGAVSILQLAAADEPAARELLAGARARGERLSFLNVPEGDPASAALAALGGTLEVRQLELVLPPSPA